MIRPARSTDAAALAELAAETFPLACPPDARPESVQHFIATHLTSHHFDGYLADEERELLVCEVDGILTGYTMLVFGEPSDGDVVAALTRRPTAELSKCYVRASAHGSGVAGELMAASIEAARARGAAGLWLGVNKQNGRANRFYEKNGLVEVGSKRFLVGERWEDDFVRELAL